MSTRSASFDDDNRTLQLEPQQAERALPTPDEKADPYLVSFDPDDPANPQVLFRFPPPLQWFYTPL